MYKSDGIYGRFENIGFIFYYIAIFVFCILIGLLAYQKHLVKAQDMALAPELAADYAARLGQPAKVLICQGGLCDIESRIGEIIQVSCSSESLSCQKQ